MRDLSMFKKRQVFLNYPFDEEYEEIAYAMHFAVIAAGLLPVCAKDLSLPDQSRLVMLYHAILNCQYSAHDLSRGRGEGETNYARLNMPLELGMALFHNLYSEGRAHRYAFFVADPNEYKAYASDLAGLDAQYHENNDLTLLTQMYEWLRSVMPGNLNGQPATANVISKYQYFKEELKTIIGSGKDGRPTHAEAQELMYQICEAEEWWVWRGNPFLLEEFPPLPLSRRS
jgi:hypothetical protein